MKLSDICDYATDRTNISKLDKSNYISTENMLPNKSGITLAATLPTTTQIPAYKIDDVLVSNIRPYFKKIWKANFDGGCSADVLVFRAKENVNSDFLYYVLSSDKFFEYSMATSKGTKMPRGDKKSIMEFEVPNFDFSTQKKIAEVLSCLDAQIELNRRINENLEQQAGAIFKEWFVDNAKSEYMFEEKSLYSFAEFINGTSFKEDEYNTERIGFPIIKIIELKNGITDATQYCAIQKDEKYYIKDKDILFSWSGNPETSIDTFIWTRGNAILNQHTFKIIPNNNHYSFIYFLLKYFKPKFKHIASNKQTTGLGHITVKDLQRLTFGCCEKAIKDFEQITVPIFYEIIENTKQSQTLAQIRDTLLPKLMNGEIEV